MQVSNFSSQGREHKVFRLVILLFILLLALACAPNLSLEKLSYESKREIGTSASAEPAQITPTSMYDASLVTEIFALANGNGVNNGATKPSTFENKEPWNISMIYTYHWNDANGASPLGPISLKEEGGTIYGPWETVPLKGQGGVPNAFWAASPINFVLPPGKYTVIDSDPGTWSQNSGTDGAGMFWVNGIRLKN